MGYGYTRTREAASAASTILLVVCVASRLVVNGVAGSILYASGVPAAYSYQYSYPYALAYSSYTQPSLLANHLLPLLDVNYDISSPLATVIQRTETPLKDASSFADDDDNVEDDGDDDDASRGSADDGTKSEETPNNQSSAQPPSLLGKEESLPVIPSVFLDQTPSTALAGDQPSTFPTSTPTPIPTLTEEADKLKYYYPSLPVTYTISSLSKPLVWPTTSQFHLQDRFGHYNNYGYANEHSSKQEFKLLDGGLTRGAYNYIDAAEAKGKLQTVSYVSSDDGNGEGFRVAATNLPQPSVVGVVEIPDSPEVATAKAAHLQALSEAVAMANVNRANNAAAAAGSSANPSGDNVVSGCNETSEVKR